MKSRTTIADENAHLDLLELLARFAKARFFYPSNNSRVSSARIAVASALRLLHKIEQGAVALRLNGNVFSVADEAIDTESPIIDWLRDAFLKSSLGRVEFAVGVPEESLEDFAGRLQSCLDQSSSGFEARWGEPIAGIETSDLRLFGRHGEFEEGEDEPPPDASELQRNAMVSHVLLGNVDVAKRLGEIRQVMEKHVIGGDGEESDESKLATLDLLEPICHALPDEAFQDPAAMCDLVSQALTACVPRMLSLIDREQMDEQDAIETLTMEVGRHFFARSKNELAGINLSELPEGRPEDEGIVDDLQMMLTEYGQLPRQQIRLDGDSSIRAKEKAGVLLHHLVTSEHAAITDVVSDKLEELFASHPDLTDLLRTYVLAGVYGSGVSGSGVSGSGEEGASRQNLWRALDFAHERGLAGEVANSALDVRVICRSFPNLFAAFLDRLKPNDRECERELDSALRKIGLERMTEAAEWLVTDGGLVDRKRLAIALGTGHDVMAPTIDYLANITTGWVREEIVAYLRRRPISEDIATAVRVVRPLSALTPRYLAGLAAPRIDENERRWLAEEAGRLVRAYLEKTRDRDDEIENRQRAARQLGSLPSAENLLMLRDLIREVGLKITSRQRFTLRRIAKDTHRSMKKKLARQRHE